MAKSNLERMIELANEFFDVRNDPEQISVDEEVRARLQLIDPATMTEERDEQGPIAWVLLIPTIRHVMDDFVQKRINERELLNLTPIGAKYDALYLCSALVLPEHRGKGIARRLTKSAVKSIQTRHVIASLFCWPFSLSGEKLAESIATEIRLPLFKRIS